jgi:hypothetical protein
MPKSQVHYQTIYHALVITKETRPEEVFATIN